ncbi:hypothetical protein [Paracoccus sediminilitoris]|uniref:hypothetical protein n=1 Tax=Paracoccus sediminilitoris TaxID=2202419 RepID=UPI0011B94A5C|nr:hypothetical protein [Paracoccus sediminilitoris]
MPNGGTFVLGWVLMMKKTYDAPALRIHGTLEDLNHGLGSGKGFPGKGHACGHDKKHQELTFS